MTFSTLLFECVKRLPHSRLSFNIKFIAIMWFCVYPCVIYVQLGFYRTIKNKYISESFRKHVLLGDEFSQPLLFITFDDFEIFLFITLTIMGLTPVLFLRPKDLILKGETNCKVCRGCNDIHDLDLPSSDRSVGDEIRLHLKLLHQSIFFLIIGFAELFMFWLVDGSICSVICLGKINHRVSRTRHALCVLCGLVSIIPTLLLGVLYGITCLVIVLLGLFALTITYSPFVCLLICSILKIVEVLFDSCNEDEACGCLPRIITVVVLFFIFVLSYSLIFLFVNFLMLFISCNFITSVLGYTIVGLVLNADIVTPYAAFFLVVTTNIYLCYANLQNRYKEVKGIILKFEKEILEIHKDSSDPEDTIPKKLFWFVCDKVLPIKSEFCLMLGKIVLILAFLFLVAHSIVSFGNQYNVSVVFSTIAVVVSGVIPALVLKQLTKENTFIGWKKIKIKREIETAGRVFYKGRNSTSSRDMEGGQSHINNDDDTLV